MARTLNEVLVSNLGNMAMQISQLQAENESLREQLAAAAAAIEKHSRGSTELQ